MNNLLCSMCHSEDATCFCYCNGQDTILCELDYQRHTQKTKIVHLKCPLAALPDHKIPGYFERLSARTSRIELGKTDLVKNLEVVDTCIAELSIKETQILTTLTDFFEDRIVHLHEVKSGLEREIYEAIEEVDSTMYEDTPVLHNKLSQFLRQGRTSLNFFKYVIDSSPYPSDLNNVLQFTQGIDADTTEFPSVPSSSQELKDTVSRLSVANEKIKVLEARLQYWGIVFDPPIEYQGTVSDYTTPKSRAAIKKFGSYPSQDEEIVLVKRGPVVLEEGVYTGHWNNRNERHGYGKFSYKSGELYEGHWQNGNKTGKGRSISPDGTVYIGEFFLGVFSGLGTF